MYGANLTFQGVLKLHDNTKEAKQQMEQKIITVLM